MRSLWVCGLVFFSLVTLSSVTGGATSRGAWSLGGWNLRDKTIFSVFKDLLGKYPEQIRHGILDDLVSRIEDPVERDHYKRAMDDAIVDTFAIRGPPCTICMVLAKVVQIVIAVDGYQNFEDNVIDYCIILANALDPTQVNNAKQMCDVVKYQGPPISDILATMDSSIAAKNHSTVFDICQSLNACYRTPDESEVLMQPHALPQAQTSLEQPTRHRVARRKRQQGPELIIAQITDVHIEQDYAENTNENCPLYVCCLAEQGWGTSKTYGSYECNIPLKTMELFIDKVIQSNPDIIIFSGDVPPHTMWDETKESQLSCPEALTAALRRKLVEAGVDIPVYPTLGNHEMYPTNLLSIESAPDTADMLKQFAQMWKDLANFTDDEVQSMEQFGFYTMLSKFENLRILSINTDYLYTANYYNVINHKRNRVQSQIAKYEATVMKEQIQAILSQSRLDGEKVIIINHHPPGGGDYIISESQWYEALMVNYTDIVVLQVAGHTHTDEFRLLKDKNNTVHSMVYVSPSMDTSVMRNPSMRLYRLNRETYELNNYEQYFLDIEKSGTITPEIQLLYRATDEYGLVNMSAASWENLLRRFQTDDVLLQLHRKHSNANAPGTEPEPCDEACKRAHICRQLHANFDHYEVCAAGHIEPTVPTIPTTQTFPPFVRETTPRPNRCSVLTCSYIHHGLLTLLSVIYVFKRMG